MAFAFFAGRLFVEVEVAAPEPSAVASALPSPGLCGRREGVPRLLPSEAPAERAQLGRAQGCEGGAADGEDEGADQLHPEAALGLRLGREGGLVGVVDRAHLARVGKIDEQEDEQGDPTGDGDRDRGRLLEPA